MNRAVTALTVACLAATGCSEVPDRSGLRVAGDDSSDTASGARAATPGALDSLISQGEAFHVRAQFDSARTLWELALVEARAREDTLRQARVLTWLGLAAWRQGRYAEAATLGGTALRLKLAAGLEEELWRSYNALGLLAWNEGRLLEASELFDEAFRSARRTDDQAGIARATNNLALVQTDLGHFAEARAGYLETLRAGRELGDALLIGGALSNLGMLEIQLGEPDAAIRHLTEARHQYRTIDYQTGEQNALGQLGTAYEGLGQPGMALAALDSALAMARALGLPQEEASNLELIAALHRQGGDLQGALRLYDEANRLNAELGLTTEFGWNLRSSAELHAVMGDYDQANTKLLEARRIHRSGGARLQELRDLLMLADVASRSGEFQDAVGFLAASEELSRDLDARTARVEVALTRATVARRAGEPTRVLAVLQEAEADLSKGGYGTEWIAYSLRARAFAGLAQLDSAVAAGRQAVAAVERMRGAFGSPLLGSVLAGDREGPYVDLVDVLLQLGRTSEAFEVADAGRTKALVEHLPGTSRERSIPATVGALAEGESLLRQIDNLVILLAELEGTAPEERDSHTAGRIQALTDQIERVRGEYETSLARAWSRDAVGTTLLGSRPAGADDVRRALRGDEVLLEYFVGPHGLWIFAVTREAVRSLRVDVSSADLARRVRLVRDLVIGTRSADGPEADEVLEGMHQLLMAPLDHAGLLTGARRLLIVPSGSLAYLPFAALRSRASDSYLVERYTLLQVPSAAALVALRSSGEKRRPAQRLTEASVFAPFPRDLPGSAREARAVRTRLGDATIHEGRRATEARLRAALVVDDVVHVATHGIMNPRNPMFSRLELERGRGDPADDGRLEVHELLGLTVSAHLVFLSGCETGVGSAWSTAFFRGDDYATLSQAFLYAGAQSVIATLWRIGDEGADRFAQRFYESATDAEPADALAAAQRALLREGRFAHPYFWAAYTVAGA